ncbi:MAG: TIGR01212 family radical SAM protein [Oligoflexia bacterium]|nr:TIGR01212 family radical SAM protein [Oligoflexia bacterium]
MADFVTPYYSINDFYRKRFGEKIRKIPVTIADDCPNRRGLKGMETCVFCDVWGSAAYEDQKGQSLKDQIQTHMHGLAAKHNCKSFLIYFQSYTSTFLGTKTLRKHFDEALSVPEVKGFVIGTRPDCVSQAVLELWNEYEAKCFVSVELGVQSFYEDQIRFLRRGHSAKQSIEVIKKIKAHSNVDLGVHLIFGIPGETDSDIIETAKLISSLPIDNVKLHNLHVLKNTPLEKLYENAEFTPIELDEYTRRVGIFLQYLNPDIAIHRLAAVSSRWEELVAPQWTRFHLKTYEFIKTSLLTQGIKQGQLI